MHIDHWSSIYLSISYMLKHPTQVWYGKVNKIVWMPIFSWNLNGHERDHWINKIVLKDKQHHDSKYLNVIDFVIFLNSCVKCFCILHRSYVQYAVFKAKRKYFFFNESVMTFIQFVFIQITIDWSCVPTKGFIGIVIDGSKNKRPRKTEQICKPQTVNEPRHILRYFSFLFILMNEWNARHDCFGLRINLMCLVIWVNPRIWFHS